MAPVVASVITDDTFGNSITVGVPTGTSNTDILIYAWSIGDDVLPTTLPGDLTELATSGTDGVNSAVWVGAKIADGTETGFTFGTTDNKNYAIIGLRITGGPSVIGDLVTGAINIQRDTAIDCPAVTSPAADSLSLLIAVEQDDWPMTYSAGYAEEAFETRPLGSIGIASDVVGSGSTGTQTATISGTEWNLGLQVLVPAGGAGGTDVTVTPGTGAATVTGAAPTVSADASIAPGLGAASVEGFAPTVTTSTVVNVSVTPGTGTATVLGFAPSISAGVAASPGTSTATVGGFAPGVSAGVVAAPGAATATVEGFAPTFTTLEVVDVTVSPGTGSTSVSGSAPSVAADAAVTPDTGTAIVRGFAPVVNNDGSGQPAKMRRCLGIGLGL